MATINLGNIKFNWKGTYNAGTAYAVDDVVSYNGSSYVCILASTGNLPTNTTYWNVMSQAGTNGTDLTTTLTTQGDILYRDGSGLQRLAKGTSGQVLKQGTNHPEWGTDQGGKILQVVHGKHTSQASTTSNSFQDVSSNTNVTITPSSTSSKILVLAHFHELYHYGTENNRSHYIAVYRDSTEIHQSHTTYTTAISNEEMMNQSLNSIDEPNTTSAITYKMKFRSLNNGQTVKVNQNSSTGGSTLILMEIAG